MLEQSEIDQVAEIIRSKVTEEESKEFFKIGKYGDSLFISRLGSEHDTDTLEEFADALIYDMREDIKQTEIEREESREWTRYTHCLSCGDDTTRRVKHDAEIGSVTEEYCGQCDQDRFLKVDDSKEVIEV